MFGRLVLVFTLLPVLELYLLMQLGGALGAVPTVALVLGTGLLGAGLARREGLRVLREWQGALQCGELPREGIVSSLLVLVGGVLLVTPGVLTDVFGIAMLIPPSRRAAAALVQRYAQRHLEITSVHAAGFVSGAPPSAEPGFADDDAIEVEARAQRRP